jgi:hypothetical protein
VISPCALHPVRLHKKSEKGVKTFFVTRSARQFFPRILRRLPTPKRGASRALPISRVISTDKKRGPTAVRLSARGREELIELPGYLTARKVGHLSFNSTYLILGSFPGREIRKANFLSPRGVPTLAATDFPRARGLPCLGHSFLGRGLAVGPANHFRVLGRGHPWRSGQDCPWHLR